MDYEDGPTTVTTTLVSLLGSSIATRDSDKPVSTREVAVEVHVAQCINPVHFEATFMEDGWMKIKGGRSSQHCQPRSKERALPKSPKEGLISWP